MAVLLDMTKFSFEEFTRLGSLTESERPKLVSQHLTTTWSPFEVKKVVPMTLLEETAAILLFLFGVPGSVLSFPFLLTVIGYLTRDYTLTYAIGLSILLGLAVFPARYRADLLHSWCSFQVLRYFSFKELFTVPLSPNKSYIFVSPPHGVFPFGNLACMLACPSITGISCRALAATAAVQMPIFKQLLCPVGAVDASKETALKVLGNHISVGVSSGGVAEIFETDPSPESDEVIVLKCRKGIIKLAFRTGAALVPCYLFGNTQLYDLWTGQGDFHEFLRTLSRKLGAALLVFWGRFYLPIPYRVPILCVVGRPIEVEQCNDPSEKQVDALQQRLIDDMQKLFDDHKSAYGWDHKRLLIK